MDPGSRVKIVKRLTAFCDRLITFRRQVIFIQPLEPGVPLQKDTKVPTNVEFHFPLSERLIEDLQFEGGDTERRQIERYLKNGEMLGVLISGHKVACRCLARPSGEISLEGHLHYRRIADDEVFIHYCRTAEAFRGQGLYPLLLSGMVSALKNSGDFSRAVISCRSNNVASVKGITRAGFRPDKLTLTVGFLGGRYATTWLRGEESDITR